MRRFLCCVLAFFALAAMPQRAAAQNDIPGYPAFDAFDAREVAMLPAYCKHGFYFRDKVPGGNDSHAIQGWIAVMGPTFNHIHHYCFGLMKTNRAVLLARSENVRVSYLNDSLREFDYVLERAAPGFVLLPEIHTKKAENLIRLGKGPLGVEELDRAIEAKPDYWPAYAQMADYYKDSGQKSKAREALQRGLAAAPNTPALLRRLAELDSSPAGTKTSSAKRY